MLELRNISKRYKTGDLVQRALDGVSLSFRENEFVAVLGPSGSGKTTLLNIVGGLDRYDDGDLIINSVSTKKYNDRNWDAYRNHTIGFVFQSYNLIPHQSVLANVELALTISGVSRAERRKRAVEALDAVGLRDQMHKRPNQMSGGQMQRVAIARALVNDPDVLLADEPTGALDSETSVQVMELLKKVAEKRLVIMVTHNGELADAYATRIVRLKDGRVTGDTDPYDPAAEEADNKKTKSIGKTSLSFFTALSLSLNNLKTKKGRTFLTAFAGSIGIIGIALILALSNGIHNYVNDIQRETLASYPVMLEREPNNFLKSLTAMREDSDDEREERNENTVYTNPRLYRMFNAAFTGNGEANNLSGFKTYLENELKNDASGSGLSELVSAVQYSYNLPLNVYFRGQDGEYHNTDLTKAIFGDEQQEDENTGMSMFGMVSSRMSSMNLWAELISGKNGELIDAMLLEQYDLLTGKWPEKADELVLIVDENSEIPDTVFYALGIIEQGEIEKMLNAVLKAEAIDESVRSATFDELLDKRFKLIFNFDYYRRTANDDTLWEYIGEDKAAMELIIKNGFELKVVGIIKPNSSSAMPIGGSFGYTSLLTEYVAEKTAESELIAEQSSEKNENLDLLSGRPFVITDEQQPTAEEKAASIVEYFNSLDEAQKVDTYTKILALPDPAELSATVEGYLAMYPSREKMIELAATTFGFDLGSMEEYLAEYSDEELKALMSEQMVELVGKRYSDNAELQVQQLIMQYSDPSDIFGISGYMAVAGMFDEMIKSESDTEKLAVYYDKFMPSAVSGKTLDERLKELGSIDLSSPETISIYALTFDDKEAITKAIDEYNSNVENEEDAIEYTDYVALLMSGVTTMIDAVSYGLISFVAVSLVVSSIMIGIITYISVLERTKEIGILRSIGASKRDISSVFNAETMTIGFFSGVLGIAVTMLLCIPINLLLRKLTGIETLTASLPAAAAAILVAISMLLTLISGLIPAGIAARKDPVTALRTE